MRAGHENSRNYTVWFLKVVGLSSGRWRDGKARCRSPVFFSIQVPTFLRWASEKNPTTLPTATSMVAMQYVQIASKQSAKCGNARKVRTGSGDTNEGSGINVLLLSKKCLVLLVHGSASDKVLSAALGDQPAKKPGAHCRCCKSPL